MDYHQIENQVFKIWQEYESIDFFTPTNQAEEKEKFFSQQNYNPHFEYMPVEGLLQVKEQLLDLNSQLGKKPMEKLLSKKIMELIGWMEMLGSRATSNITKHSTDRYGIPSSDIILKAKSYLNLEAQDESLTVSSDELVHKLKIKAKEMDIDWRIEEDDHLSSKAYTDPMKQELRIKKGARFSENDVQRLGVHELGVHVMRSKNSLKTGYKLLFMGTAGYLATEEGLAATMEKNHGVLRTSTLKTYAGRAMAVHLSLTKSFNEVYAFLKGFFTSEESYAITQRAKRGLTDTSQPGAFTKDHLYLKGYLMLKDFNDIDSLFVGKIGVDDLELIKDIL